ncbi:AraC family transcriptional regulator [Cohnella abietis]|uniref:AraC family transcriptional regulator n=1 Tax=Cohnella abietis TaxID=2507935 RepID=A0A3T1D5A9_9BACL|nr:AraC family transcriptional regulator [Cohnella abietis]BBI33290.1 hypothetical protein KCTCHS21_26890 [Cohnella abietis]
MQLNEQIVLWNQASIKLMDIRFITMKLHEELRSYRLPANGFLFAMHGHAQIKLDGITHEANRFHILHASKGCCLDICPIEDEFGYYIIYYKAMILLPVRQEILSMMERSSPFQIQYGFAPNNPAAILQKVQLMHKKWEEQGVLERFHVKALFYQFVHELMLQIQSLGIPTLKADLAAQAKNYLHEHYAEPITLDILAERLDSSPRHLSRLFKRETGSSPIDYMIQIRMDKAKELLLTTEATLQEIAVGIGYPDSYYFAKMFKRYVGSAPIRYRMENKKQRTGPNLPSASARYGIVQDSSRLYIDYDNHYQYKGEKKLAMYQSNKTPLAVTLLLCLTLLLSACSTGATNSNSTNGGTQSPSNQASATASNESSINQTAEAEPQKRTVSTVKGDIEVPANPKRVVVLYLLGDVLALGVKPVGVSAVEDEAAFKNELTEAQNLGTWFEPSREAVLALDPDVIIVPSEETYQMLHQIAPTVYIPYEKLSIEERLKKIGEVLGKEGESQTLLDNFNAKVEINKKKLQEAGILDKTVSIMEGGDKDMTVVTTKRYGRGSQVIYEYLGMKGPKTIEQEIENSKDEATGKSVSFEVLADYSGDYIFRSAYEGMTDLSDNVIWNKIPAVKEGRLIEISFGLSYYNDIYSLDKQLDFITDSLLATVK